MMDPHDMHHLAENMELNGMNLKANASHGKYYFLPPKIQKIVAAHGFFDRELYEKKLVHLSVHQLKELVKTLSKQVAFRHLVSYHYGNGNAYRVNQLRVVYSYNDEDAAVNAYVDGTLERLALTLAEKAAVEAMQEAKVERIAGDKDRLKGAGFLMTAASTMIASGGTLTPIAGLMALTGIAGLINPAWLEWSEKEKQEQEKLLQAFQAEVKAVLSNTDVPKRLAAWCEMAALPETAQKAK